MLDLLGDDNLEFNPIKIYLEVVSYLINYEKDGRKLYVEKNERIHIKPKVFKSYLNHLVGSNNLNTYLKTFRLLELIIVQKRGNAFTNIQRINGRLLTVITIDKTKFKKLEELQKS